MSRLRFSSRVRSAFTLFDRLFAYERSFGDTKAVAPTRLNFTTLEDRIVPDGRPLPLPRLVYASGHGDAPMIRLADPESGETLLNAQPFGGSFRGGNSVASTDFNNDTVPDIVVSAGKGGGPRLRIYDGNTNAVMTGSPLNDIWAFELNYTGGVEVAAGNVNGDGLMDVIVAPMAGGGPRVRVFSGTNAEVLADFWAYAPTFTGGLHIASAAFDIDNRDDIVVSAGAGGGPRISIYTGKGEMLPNKLGDFFAFDPADRSGVYVAVGDVNGDTLPNIITGSGNGAVSTVRLHNYRDGSLMTDQTVFGDEDTSGVRVASAFIN